MAPCDALYNSMSKADGRDEEAAQRTWQEEGGTAAEGQEAAGTGHHPLGIKDGCFVWEQRRRQQSQVGSAADALCGKLTKKFKKAGGGGGEALEKISAIFLEGLCMQW